MRLKYTSIAQIENVVTLQRDEYLTKSEMHTDQAVRLRKRKQKVRELYGRQGT